MTREELREEAKKVLTGYTERELDAYVEGAIRAGVHISKKRDDDWYKRQKEKRERPNAFVEYLMTESPLARAVENLKRMKTYDEIESETISKLIDALTEPKNVKEREAFFEMTETLLEKKMQLERIEAHGKEREDV